MQIGSHEPSSAPVSHKEGILTQASKKLDEIAAKIKGSDLFQKVQPFLFLKVKESNGKEKHYLRLNVKAAGYTVSNLKKRLDVGNKEDSMFENIGKRVALGVVSRLYTIAALPYQIIRDLVYMPKRMYKAIKQAGHEYDLSKDPKTNKISNKKFLGILAKNSWNMTKVVLTPVTSLIGGLYLTVVGIENCKSKRVLMGVRAIKCLKPEFTQPNSAEAKAFRQAFYGSQTS